MEMGRMILGVFSDTHDNVSAARAGIKTLRANGAEFLIHCGDVGGQHILDLLAGIPSAFVWGNNDFDRPLLKGYAEGLGIQCCDDFGHLELGGRQVAIMHGDNLRHLAKITEGNIRYDYLFVGHSHVPSDERVGHTRIINPGALHRAAKKTVALVDTQTDVLRHLVVKI